MPDQATQDAPNDQLPLVTFALFAYNQEKYIREAVDGALAQTYSPLQIILSDDCSSDRTFQIIEEMVAHYAGPHEVLLNKNQQNLGVGGHVNRIMQLALGELIVAAAGDDISVEQRTSLLVNHWLRHGRPSALCSDCFAIDEKGTLQPLTYSWLENFSGDTNQPKEALVKGFIKTQKPALLGCTEAWSKDVFHAFSDLSPGVWFEDNALSLRAWLLNGIAFIPDRLVYYRQHSTNICNRTFVVDRTRAGFRRLELEKAEHARRLVYLLKGYSRDITTALEKGIVNSRLAADLTSEISAQLFYNQIIRDWWSVNLRQRLAWRKVASSPISYGFRHYLGIFRLMPLEVFLICRSFASQVRGVMRIRVPKK